MNLPLTFFNEVLEELKKVSWPTQSEIIRLTIVVLIVSVAVGAFIGSLDFTFTKITELVLK